MIPIAAPWPRLVLLLIREALVGRMIWFPTPATTSATVSETRPAAAITRRKPSALIKSPLTRTFSSPNAPIQRPRRNPCTRKTAVPMNRNMMPMSRAPKPKRTWMNHGKIDSREAMEKVTKKATR